MEIEDDEIMATLDLYMSKDLADNLHLFQFCARTTSFPLDSTPTLLRIKPNAKLIEMDVPSDTYAITYDRKRGAELALGLNELSVNDTNSSDYHQHHNKLKATMLENQTLSSSLVPCNSNYAVGVIRNSEYTHIYRGIITINNSVQL